jgi:hypothetical protein
MFIVITPDEFGEPIVIGADSYLQQHGKGESG